MRFYARPRCGLQERTSLTLIAIVTLAAVLVLPAGLWQSSTEVVSFLGIHTTKVPCGSTRGHLVKPQLHAADAENIVDAELLEEEADEVDPGDGAFPPEAYAEYGFTESPPRSWFERNKIDKHKVNSVFFDMFAKPKNFFPHKLQPGDTVRVYYRDPQTSGDKQISRSLDISSMKTVFFDGVILNFRGDYHARNMRLRAMMGKSSAIMGVEMVIPMHSPLVEEIVVLRRGYIGRNKNAYFIRGMIGSANKRVIPLDKERTEMDKKYNNLRESGQSDQIPESEYPQNEWDRYPLPKWKQDEDDWEEENYKAEDVDQRSQYEIRVIGAYRKRIPGPRGRIGAR